MGPEREARGANPKRKKSTIRPGRRQAAEDVRTTRRQIDGRTDRQTERRRDGQTDVQGRATSDERIALVWVGFSIGLSA